MMCLVLNELKYSTVLFIDFNFQIVNLNTPLLTVTHCILQPTSCPKMSNRGPLQSRENLPQMSAEAQIPKTAKSDYGPNYPKGEL